MPAEPGRQATLTRTVTADDTATALGSGDVPVLATPRLLAWAEAATVAAVGDALGSTSTSVGSRVALEHRAASPVGAVVVLTAELVAVEGRMLRFTVEARDDVDVVGTAEVERVVVDRARFLSRLGARSG